jgi:NAD(P)H-binding
MSSQSADVTMTSPAEGLAPWASRHLPRTGGGTMTVTAVPGGGYYLAGAGRPTVYVGDGGTASPDVLRTIVQRLGSAPVAVLDEALPPAEAATAAEILGARAAAPAQRLMIIGGTCLTGFAIAREALARGHHVTVLGQGTDHAEALEYAEVVVEDPFAAPPEDVAFGQDAIVSAVTGQCDGDPRMIFALASWLLQAAETAHVPRLLWAGSADGPDDEMLAQAQALEVLRGTQTPVRWSSFTPTGDLVADARAAVDELEQNRTAS